jgi:uncharacterized protein
VAVIPRLSAESGDSLHLQHTFAREVRAAVRRLGRRVRARFSEEEMNAKKQRDKIRRRANRIAQEAWDAAADNHFDLAVRIIRRAAELNPANPVLWHDQGRLLLELQQDEPAAQAFQAAIQLAPDFAEAYASLAAIRARQGKMEQAVTLGREAARRAPDSVRHKDALAGYEALLINGYNASRHADAKLPTDEQKGPVEPPICDRWPELTARIDRLNWPEIDGQLSAHGVAHMPSLLNATCCEALRSMFGQDRRFAKTVAMNKSRFGKGIYRYFAHPIPPLVDAIRRLVYPCVSEIANRWQTLLKNEDRYPATWFEFRDRRAAAGQTTPSPLLLSYDTGGFNALHQDIRGEVFFPIQLVVVLSPLASSVNDASGFTGGEFLLCDDCERHAIPAGLGDAILFCTCGRLVRLGAGYGLQPVKHGLSGIESGNRFAIGIPFHEFR